ncbi:MarR family transcriptional regulator [Myxococcota bacterium]|nr:MarR family transcriptional regulator [Myxococcota bacterium]
MAKGQGIDDQLCFALYTASRAMTRAYQPILEPLGLTYPQYLTLLVLWEDDGQRVSALGDRLHLDSATLTPLLKRLEAQGLVRRSRSAQDERVVEVSLTEAGWALRERAAHVPLAMLCQTGLDLGELVALREQLKALTARLRG